MNSLSDFFIAAGAVLAVVAALGGALAGVRGSYNKARIQALREDVGDFSVRLKSCEEQLAESQAREATLQTKVNHLESENTLLSTMVTQRADVDTVLNELRDHHREVMENHAELISAVKEIAA